MSNTGNRWVRIPLIGDVEGAILLLPDEPFSEQNWRQMLATLDAMKPGLVQPADTEEPTDV